MRLHRRRSHHSLTRPEYCFCCLRYYCFLPRTVSTKSRGKASCHRGRRCPPPRPAVATPLALFGRASQADTSQSIDLYRVNNSARHAGTPPPPRSQGWRAGSDWGWKQRRGVEDALGRTCPLESKGWKVSGFKSCPGGGNGWRWTGYGLRSWNFSERDFNAFRYV